jgi:hypothetical protein
MNFRTSNVLGPTVPPTLLTRADALRMRPQLTCAHVDHALRQRTSSTAVGTKSPTRVLGGPGPLGLAKANALRLGFLELSTFPAGGAHSE